MGSELNEMASMHAVQLPEPNPLPPHERAAAMCYAVCVRDQFKFAPGRSRSSCTCFLAFSTFFGRGLKAKMEASNEGKYLKIWEVGIWW